MRRSQQRQAGFMLMDAIFGVIFFALTVQGFITVFQLLDHYSDIWGTLGGFAHIQGEHRAYFRAYPDELAIPEFTMLQSEGLGQSLQVQSATVATRGRTWELRDYGGQRMLTTVVENEARAQRIARKLRPTGAYEVEDATAGTFRVRQGLIRTPSLETLIDRHSIHVTASATPGDNRLASLSFSPRAIRVVGEDCRDPKDGQYKGAFAISATDQLLVCQQIFGDQEERIWQIAGRGATCPTSQVCWNGTRICTTDTCPAPPQPPRCGDGTVVTDVSTQCKTCPGFPSTYGSSQSCPTLSCGDGTIVTSLSSCVSCEGSSVGPGKTCPTTQPTIQCNDGTVVNQLGDCKTCIVGGVSTTVGPAKSCPTTLQYCRDDSTTPVSNPATDCKTCSNNDIIPNHKACAGLPPIQQCGDGTIVSDASKDCKTCPGSGTNIPVGDNCVSSNRCDDGTVVMNPSRDCQACCDGTNAGVHTNNCPATQTCWNSSTICATDVCPQQPKCDDGTLVNALSECQSCGINPTVGPGKSCPATLQCGDGTVVSDRSTECQDCWDGTNIDVDKTCPTQPTCDDGTAVNSLSECEPCCNGTSAGAGKCPGTQICWNSTVICASDSCPPQPTCGDGTPVTDPATECQTCWDGNNIAKTKVCPAKPNVCASGGTYPNCCSCPQNGMTANDTATQVVWTCNPKPVIRVPFTPDSRFTIVHVEHACHIEQLPVCVVDAAVCWGPGNYCANPVQVWYNSGGICADQSGRACGPGGATGFVCEGGIGT